MFVLRRWTVSFGIYICIIKTDIYKKTSSYNMTVFIIIQRSWSLQSSRLQLGSSCSTKWSKPSDYERFGSLDSNMWTAKDIRHGSNWTRRYLFCNSVLMLIRSKLRNWLISIRRSWLTLPCWTNVDADDVMFIDKIRNDSMSCLLLLIISNKMVVGLFFSNLQIKLNDGSLNCTYLYEMFNIISFCVLSF